MNLEYIRTTRELNYRECSGRHTVLEKGVPGFILTEGNIEELIIGSDKDREKCFEQLDRAHNFNQTLALVQGRVCCLAENDFYICEAPKMYPVINEIF
jgi:hypothetical protein